MSKIERFEDIQAWQRARELSNEFKQFLYIAHGSAAEVQSALYIALDQNYISDHEFHALYNQTGEISKMMAGFIKYLGEL